MKTIAALVEGHGDARSLPALIRRVATERMGLPAPNVLPPHRVPRTRLVKVGELERSIELLARKVGADGGILVMLDADDDCAAAMGPALRDRAVAARPDRRIDVVLPVHEYEAWFLAAAVSLRGRRGLPTDLMPPSDPEAIRDAKGWLHERMADGYSETIDQPALTSMFALDEARAASSFLKLERALERLLVEHAEPASTQE